MALTDNLISYWKLDEASGNATDAHGSNTLTDNNTVTSGTGKINGARQFTAANSEYLSHADNADLSSGDIDFTIAAWVKLDSLPGQAFAVAKSDDGSGAHTEYVLQYFGGVTGAFRLTVCDGASFIDRPATTFGTPATGTWYFVVAWHDSVNNQLGIAVNAGAADTTSYSAGLADTTAAFGLGGIAGASVFWNGLIDEVGFWKRVLTSQERTDLYNSGAGLAYPFGGGGGGGIFSPNFYLEHVARGVAA